jgi:hypothetical protein
MGIKVPNTITKPSQVLQQMILHTSDHLQKKSLSEAQKIFLRRAADQETAADYLSKNDLQRMVLVQQVWLRTLAILVADERPSCAAKAASIVEGLERDCSRETNVVEQLWLGERSIMQMWLLRLDPTLTVAKN